jgi:hypothetical protein
MNLKEAWMNMYLELSDEEQKLVDTDPKAADEFRDRVINHAAGQAEHLRDARRDSYYYE